MLWALGFGSMVFFRGGRKAGFVARPRRAPSFVFPAYLLLCNKGALMVWFLLVETETVPMGWAPYEPMMPAAQGLDTRSWLGGR